MRGRSRPLLAAFGALVVVAGIALLGRSPGAADDTDPSSRAAGGAGSLALYSWLSALGFDVTRLSGDFDLRGSDVLVVDEPLRIFSDPEVAQTESFLRAGGILILAVDPGDVAAAAPLLDRVGVDAVGPLAGGSARPPQPIDVGETVQSVNLGDLAVALGDRGAPLLDLHGRPVAVGRGVGRGVAYVIGSSFPLSNDGLRVSRPDPGGRLQPTGSDADRLLLALVDRARPSNGRVVRVAFDEVHHGEGSSGGVGAVLLTPVGLAGLLAALVVLGLLASSGRRLGRALPAGDPAQVPSASELVAAMAQLYERSGRRGSIAARFGVELRERVGAAAGVQPGIDDAAFCGALEPWSEAGAAEVRGVLGEAARLAAATPSEAELVALAQRADAATARWVAGAGVS